MDTISLLGKCVSFLSPLKSVNSRDMGLKKFNIIQTYFRLGRVLLQNKSVLYFFSTEMKKLLQDDSQPGDLRIDRKCVSRFKNLRHVGGNVSPFLVMISKLAVMLMSYNSGVIISCWKMANKPRLPTASSLNWFTLTVCISADLKS